MNGLKWYSGGKERKEEALDTIDHLLVLLDKEDQQPLIVVLNEFRSELLGEGQSVPYILSRMDLAVSRCIVENKLTFSEKETELFNQLSSLSQIKYGY